MNENSYNHHRFARWLENFFTYTPCFLCGEIHEVNIYQFVDRNTSPDNSKKIIVIRIFCQHNFQLREETGEQLQYTVTILPAFLVPHSRVPLPDIYNAFDMYVSDKQEIQQEAALIMNCQSRHSFRLYYTRFCNLVDKWIFFLSEFLSILSENEIPVKIGKKWGRFKELLKNYLSSIFGENSAPMRTRRGFIQAHVTFLHINMGLGP